MVPGGRACIADANQQVEETEEMCLWPNEMQYSLLQTVVEACQKKPQCKFSTKLKPGKADPCPLARKFVEVAYKCRPSCLTQRAVETVMQICHGKRWCHIVANNRTFSSTCRPNARIFIKVVYACVPLGVLTERYESTEENDEGTGNANNEGGYFDVTDTDENWREPNTGSLITNPVFKVPEIAIINPIRNKVNEMKITTYTSLRDNEKDSATYTSNTKILIYVSLGILIIFMLLLFIIGVRCYKNRKRTSSSKNGDMSTTETPNKLSDNVSDLDNDVDESEFSRTSYDSAHPDMIDDDEGSSIWSILI